MIALDSEEQLPKRFVQGTHRVISPEETISRVRPLLSRMGITRIANITGLDRIGVPVAVAIRPNSRSISVSQGKGLDLNAAKASAVMESLESFHAERIRLPLLLGSYEELLETVPLLEIEDLPRSRMNLFNETLTLLWVEAVDLHTREQLWMPYELVHTRFTVPRLMGAGCFYASSNGLASGNHHLEALTHAICEVVERDATTMWFLLNEEARDRCRIDPETVDDAPSRQILRLFDKSCVHVTIWETTSDIGVASFLCRIADQERIDQLHPTLGAGCHPDRGIALLRALTESAQGRATFISGSRDDLYRDEYRAALNPISLAREGAAVDTGSPLRSFRDTPTHPSEMFNDELNWLLHRLRAAGFQQAMAVDLTLPELKIPVVKVVIPGLESLIFDSNYLPGKRAKSRGHNYQ